MATGKNPFLKIKTDDVDSLWRAIHALTDVEILVGFPEDTSKRDDDPNAKPGDKEITNAALGYIHDTGMPEQNIPARPFMIPGMADMEDKVADQLVGVAKTVLTTKSAAAVMKRWERVGLTAQFGLKRKINEGIPPPLSEYTLKARARKGRKGAAKELELRGKGVAPSTQFAKPLIDTGQLRNAINYVIRKRKDRKA